MSDLLRSLWVGIFSVAFCVIFSVHQSLKLKEQCRWPILHTHICDSHTIAAVVVFVAAKILCTLLRLSQSMLFFSFRRSVTELGHRFVYIASIFAIGAINSLTWRYFMRLLCKCICCVKIAGRNKTTDNLIFPSEDHMFYIFILLLFS